MTKSPKSVSTTTRGGSSRTAATSKRPKTAGARKRSSATSRKPSPGKTPAKTSARKQKAAAQRQIAVGPLAVGILVAAIALVMAIPYLRGRIHDTGAKVPEIALNQGYFIIDISHYQGEIVWDSLMVMTDSRALTTRDLTKATDLRPVAGAVIKATEGETMTDDAFPSYWEAAGRSKVKRGAYHFFRSSKNPEKQAENFIRIVGELSEKDFPPVLDVETIHKGCSKKSLNIAVKRWLTVVEEHYGRKPIIYSSEKFLRDVLSWQTIEGYPIWVAHYGVDSPERKDWSLWQFTDKAVVFGAEGKVDLSIAPSLQ